LSQVGLLLMTIEKQLPEFHSDYGVFVKSKGTTLTRGEESFQLFEQQNGSIFSSTMSLFSFATQTEFDKALVVLLEFIGALTNYVIKKDKSHFRFTYQISKDEIGNTCIKRNSQTDEIWTLAMKKVLHHLQEFITCLSTLEDK